MTFTLSVGADTCDLRGFTNTQIQCAVDRVAFLGGGVVELSSGVFKMADALHLRTGVTVRGHGQDTILRKNAMKQAAIVTFLGFGHSDLVVDQPGVFAPGDGVIVGDDRTFGFYQTTGTLVRRDGECWHYTARHAGDYLAEAHGFVKTLYPLVSAVDVTDATAEDLVLEGNPEQNENLNGCRGGAFFAHRSNRVLARRVTARDFLGEGFSFQTCDDLELDACVAERCSGNGFHPGSGSNRFHIHHCVARHCGGGLFYCLRVRDGLLEDCTFEHNSGHGVSIGARDTGHMNRRLDIRHNGGAGIFLRAGGETTAPHANTILDCRLEANATGQDGEAEIVLQGSTEGVRLIGNHIRRLPGRPGLLVRKEMRPFEWRDNCIEPEGPGAIVRETPEQLS